MSWEASGFVKKLHENLTVVEKFVLLVLADYHRTDDRASWPAHSTLAHDCLMTERGIQQIMRRLETKHFIVRVPGCGRGNVTGYRLVGLDSIKDEQERTNGGAERTNGGAGKDERKRIKDAQPCIAIRKEPIEPIQEPIQEPKNNAALTNTLFTEGVELKTKPEIPGWVPADPWREFVEMRKRIRAPLTDRALELAVQELEKLKYQGHDPQTVLEQSVFHSWRGLFPVKENLNGGRQTRADERQQRNRAVITQGLLGRDR